jgi:hypothetical protein
MKLKFAFIFLVLIVSSCGGVDTQKVASLQTEIDVIDKDIVAAEKENEKYTGGLVKALINSQIQTLKQTRAMLQQKKDSWLYGININYTVDGKLFVLPEGAKALLPEIERDIAENKEKIKQQETVVNQYSGGLVQALSVSTLETMRQTQAMLEQRRLAIKYELPQYLSFQNKLDSK